MLRKSLFPKMYLEKKNVVADTLCIFQIAKTVHFSWSIDIIGKQFQSSFVFLVFFIKAIM